MLRACWRDPRTRKASEAWSVTNTVVPFSGGREAGDAMWGDAAAAEDPRWRYVTALRQTGAAKAVRVRGSAAAEALAATERIAAHARKALGLELLELAADFVTDENANLWFTKLRAYRRQPKTGPHVGRTPQSSYKVTVQQLRDTERRLRLRGVSLPPGMRRAPEGGDPARGVGVSREESELVAAEAKLRTVARQLSSVFGHADPSTSALPGGGTPWRDVGAKKREYTELPPLQSHERFVLARVVLLLEGLNRVPWLYREVDRELAYSPLDRAPGMEAHRGKPRGHVELELELLGRRTGIALHVYEEWEGPPPITLVGSTFDVAPMRLRGAHFVAAIPADDANPAEAVRALLAASPLSLRFTIVGGGSGGEEKTVLAAVGGEEPEPSLCVPPEAVGSLKPMSVALEPEGVVAKVHIAVDRVDVLDQRCAFTQSACGDGSPYLVPEPSFAHPAPLSEELLNLCDKQT